MGTIKCFPKRHIFTLLCFWGCFSAYTMRFNLSIAIVAMVKERQTAGVAHVEETCSELVERSNASISRFNNDSSNLQGEFEWDSKLRGQILASFFYGYVVTQVPGAILSDKYGAKCVYGTGMLATSFLSLLTPIVARWSHWALITVRFVQGLGQGVVLSCTNCLVGRWAAKMERSRVSTIIIMGCQAGNAFTLTATGLLCDSEILGGWPSAFYVFGTLGCVWYILWMFMVHESPEIHPNISKEELKYILKDQDRERNKLQVPWGQILTSVRVWALCITHMCQTWGYFTLLTELPNYLSNILHFELRNNGMLSALPQVMNCLGALLASFVADRMRKKGCLKITTIRKVFNSIGFFGAGACMLIVVFAGCQPILIVALLTLSFGVLGTTNSGFLCTHVDMSPDYAGLLMGMTLCCGSVCGFLTSTYVGWIMQDGQTVQRWNIIFITAAAVFFAGGVIYNICCSAELQNWKKTSGNSHKDGQLHEISKNCSV